MEKDNLFDGFIITDCIPKLNANDTVMIHANGDITNITLTEYYNSILETDELCVYAYDLMDTFASCNCLNLKTKDYVLLNQEEYYTLIGCDTGKVFYTDDKITIISVGVVDITDIIPENYEDYVVELNTAILETPKKDNIGVESEENIMDTMFGSGFGKCTDYRFALSVNGIAVRQKETGKYVVYNKENNEFVDTTSMLLNIKDGLFTLPASQLNIGDTIIHENKPYYIVGVKDGIKAVSYDDCVETTLIPKTTMFGVKYFTKVFSLFGDNFAANGELFNNPIMLMSLMGDNNDMSKLLAYSSIAKGDLTNNPMLMAFLMKGEDKGDFSTIAMLSMLNGKNPFATKANQE